MNDKMNCQGICAICGEQAFITRDHIPPKSMFAKPRPIDLLTIPACSRCNGGASDDDEYFRNAICMSTYCGYSRHGKAGSDAAIRSLKRSLRHRTEFAKTARRVRVPSQSGEADRGGMAFDVDTERVNSVFARIVRGIYFLEAGEVLGERWDVVVETPESFEQCEGDFKEMMQTTILQPLQSVPEKRIADGLFRYRFARANETSSAAVCWMVFYNRLPVLCLTGPKELVE